MLPTSFDMKSSGKSCQMYSQMDCANGLLIFAYKFGIFITKSEFLAALELLPWQNAIPGNISSSMPNLDGDVIV